MVARFVYACLPATGRSALITLQFFIRLYHSVDLLNGSIQCTRLLPVGPAAPVVALCWLYTDRHCDCLCCWRNGVANWCHLQCNQRLSHWADVFGALLGTGGIWFRLRRTHTTLHGSADASVLYSGRYCVACSGGVWFQQTTLELFRPVLSLWRSQSAVALLENWKSNHLGWVPCFRRNTAALSHTALHEPEATLLLVKHFVVFCENWIFPFGTVRVNSCK